MEAIMNTIVIDNNLAVKVSTYSFESALKLFAVWWLLQPVPGCPIPW
jgi:hypothetical protein